MIARIINNKFLFIKDLGVSPGLKGFQHFLPGTSWVCLPLARKLQITHMQWQPFIKHASFHEQLGSVNSFEN